MTWIAYEFHASSEFEVEITRKNMIREEFQHAHSIASSMSPDQIDDFNKIACYKGLLGGLYYKEEYADYFDYINKEYILFSVSISKCCPLDEVPSELRHTLFDNFIDEHTCYRTKENHDNEKDFCLEAAQKFWEKHKKGNQNGSME